MYMGHLIADFVASLIELLAILDLARGVSAKDKDTDKETDIGADKDKVKGEISSSDDVVVIFLEKAKKEAEEEERKQH